MKKKVLFLASLCLGASLLANSGHFNALPFEVSESTVAEEAYFGRAKISGKLKEIVRHNENELETIVTPKIGIQSQRSADLSKISIRYTAAISTLDVTATRTRAAYDATGTVLKESAQKVSKVAYQALTNGDEVLNAIDVEDENGAKPYKYFVVYTLLNIPYEEYAKGYITASLSLTRNEETVNSKEVVTTVDQTEQFSFDANTSGYFLTGTFDGEEKTIAPHTTNQDGNYAAFFTKLKTTDSFKVVNRDASSFKVLDSTALFQDKEHFVINNNLISPKVNGQYDFYISSNDATKEYIYASAAHLEKTLYFKPNEHWKSAGARFAIYTFNNATNKNERLDLTEEPNTGFYYTPKVVDSSVYDQVIFARMNPGTTENNFNKEVLWNQTADLSILPKDIGYDYLFEMKEDSGEDWLNQGKWGKPELVISSAESRTYTIEAENLDHSNLVMREDMANAGFTTFVQTNSAAFASGGKSIERYASGYLAFTFKTTESMNMMAIAGLAQAGDFDAAGLTLSVDGVNHDLHDQVYKSAQGNTYFNFIPTRTDTFTLPAGHHTFKFEFTSTIPNLDYFKLFVNPQLTSHTLVNGPDKTHYIQGDTFNPNGVLINEIYSDGTIIPVSTGFTYSSEPLAGGQTKVAMSYGDYNFEVDVEVDEFDYEAGDTLMKTIEGEDLDFAGITEKQDDKTWDKLVESNGYASGGKSLHSIKAAKWTWKVNVTKPLYLRVVSTVCKYEDVKTGDTYSVAIDGVEHANDNITLGEASGNQWYNFKESLTDVGLVSTGIHEISFEVKNGGVNIDRIDFEFFNPEKNVVEGAKTTRLEPEELSYWKIKTDGHGYIENPGNASNGHSVGHLTGGYYDYYFNSTKNFTLKPTLYLAQPDNVLVADYVKVLVDGNEFTLTNPEQRLNRAGEANNEQLYWNWQTVNYEALDVSAGFHYMQFKVLQGCNWDCIDLQFSE